MTRRTATLVWVALLVMPVAFTAVAFTVPPADVSPGLADAAFWIALGVSAVNVVLSRVVPPHLGPPRAHDRDVVAFARLLVGLALCEAAAMAPPVAWIVAHDRRLLGVLALDLLALVILFPSESRWETLMPDGDAELDAPRGGARHAR